MDPKMALQIFGLAEFPKTLTELRSLHKKLALANHPDRGGSLEKMKDINAANDVLKQWVGKSVKTIGGFATGSASASARSNARAYKQAGKTFTTGRADREGAKAELLKTRGPIYEAILECLKKIDFFGCVTHLTDIFGEPFTHVEKAATVDDLFKMKDRTKQSWVSHYFINKSKTMVFEVELIGDSDHMAWLMRNKSNGFNNSKKFEFQWALAVYFYKDNSSSQKKVVSRRTAHSRSELTLLRDPKKLLPKAKIEKLK